MYGDMVFRSTRLAWALSTGVMFFAAGLLLLLFNASYTRRATLPGYLIPAGGVVRVFSVQAGRADQIMVREGEHVHAGQALLSVVSDRADAQGRDVFGLGATQNQARQANLHRVILQQRLLYQNTRDSLHRRVESLVNELGQLENEISNQASRVAFAQDTQQRYAALRDQSFVAPAAVQEKQEMVVEQEAHLLALQRTRTQLQRDLGSVRDDLAQLPMRESTAVGELERTLTSTQQDLGELEARHGQLVVSPRDGVVSGLSIHRGQAVATEQTLMVLLPQAQAESAAQEPTAGAAEELEANLFARSKQTGFIHAGQTVLLRYSAFPYQKFGHYRAKVLEVARSPLLPAELPYPLAPEANNAVPASPEPVYRIRVALESQSAQAYGQPQALQSGMQIEADIRLDTRTVVEWMLEPLYSLRGKYLHATP